MDVDRHARARQIELARAIAHRTKVYLDACYWIIVRDAASGARTGAAERKLLHFLRRGVARGHLICPISATMFMELMKQPYTPGRRIATAAIIDELSLGVSTVPSNMIVGTEIHSFVLGAQPGAELHAMQDLIWTKVSYVLGNTYPVLDRLSADEAFRLQVGFFDRLWDIPLSKIVEVIGDSFTLPDKFTLLSKETNHDCEAFAHELRSFEGTYDIELRGAIEVLGEVAADVVEHLAGKAGDHPKPNGEARAQLVNASRNILYHAMQKPDHRNLLRSIHIEVSFHAAMRWDKQRRFKPNDYYDFHLATAALAYCDLFLTERPLQDMICRPQLKLDTVNGCRVVSNVSEAVDAVRGCISSKNRIATAA